MSLLDFFGGLSQGFGSSWQQRQREDRERQEEHNRASLGILQSAFQQAANEGDNEAAARTIDMMVPFLGGKEGKPHPLNLFSGMIRQFKPVTKDVVSQEAQQAQANINQLETQPAIKQEPVLVGDPTRGIVRKIEQPDINPLESATRPRQALEKKTIQQGFFRTPLERGLEGVELKRRTAEALLPSELAEYEAKERLRAKTWQDQEDIRQQGREHLAKIKEEGFITRDINKTASAYIGSTNPATGQPFTQDEAMEAAKEYHRNRNQAVLSEYASKAENRLESRKLRERELDAKLNRWSDLNEQAWAKIDQTERKMNMQQGSIKASVERLKSYRAEMKDIATQQNLAFRTMTDPLKSEDEKNQARQLFDQLNIEYDKRLALVEDENNKLESVGQAINQPSALTKKPAVIDRKSNKNNDPLGIR